MGASKREAAAVIGALVVRRDDRCPAVQRQPDSTILSKVGGSIPSGATSGGTSSQDRAGSAAGAGGIGQRQRCLDGSGRDVQHRRPAPTLLVIQTGTLTLEVPSIGPATASAADARHLERRLRGRLEGDRHRRRRRRDGRLPDPGRRVGADAGRPAGARDRARPGDLDRRGDRPGRRPRRPDRQPPERPRRPSRRSWPRRRRSSDVLAVQKQLTDTRGQIEELVAQKTSLEDRAAFGSLAVTFRLPAAAGPAATRPPGWDPGERRRRGRVRSSSGSARRRRQPGSGSRSSASRSYRARARGRDGLARVPGLPDGQSTTRCGWVASNLRAAARSGGRSDRPDRRLRRAGPLPQGIKEASRIAVVEIGALRSGSSHPRSRASRGTGHS